MKKRHFTIPVFIPEAACPNRCVFCNQHSISGATNAPSVEEVTGKIEAYLQTIPSGTEVEVGFFGGNFTGIPEEMQQAYLQSVQQYISAGRISCIRISTRPDYINPEVLMLLKKYHVTTIELGAQSLDDEVLRLSGRGHTAEDVRSASLLIRTFGFELGLQMMVGLPGDTLDKSMLTAKEIIRLGASSTRIYPTLVIKGTELEHLYLQNKYQPLSLEGAINIVAGLADLFVSHKVKILRIGLHPSEGLLDGSSLVAGPFHVAFGEMVYSRIWHQRLFHFLNNPFEDEFGRPGVFHITVAPGMKNAVTGYKAANKQMLLLRYEKMVVSESNKYKDFECCVDIC